MGQKRITDFFHGVNAAAATAPTTSPFMKLPPTVRQAIYNLAGIPEKSAESFIDLNCWPLRHIIEDCYDSHKLILDPENPDEPQLETDPAEAWDRPQPYTNWESEIPINLLLVSRAIHDEVENDIYRSSAWGVSASGPGGLGVFERLSPKAVNAIGSLLVCLTPCVCYGCVSREPCLYPIQANLRLFLCETKASSARGSELNEGLRPADPSDWDRAALRNQRPLGIRSSLDKHTIAQWNRMCEKLSRHAEPWRLSLYVHCLVSDVSTAERIAKPLRRLRSLRDFGISFGYNEDMQSSQHRELSSLAQDTGRAVTQKPTFPFLDLPTELQLRILSFTPLVNHEYDYQFYDKAPYLSVFKHDVSEEHLMKLQYVDGKYAVLLSHAFCAKRNAAFKDRCCCATLPASYFLVSRRFRQLALEMFYGRNRIITMYHDLGWCTGVREPGWDAPAAQPALDVLHHLTWLSLRIRIRNCIKRTVQSTRLEEFLSAHARLPALTLELHVRDMHSRNEVVAALHGGPGIYEAARPRRRHAEIYRVLFRRVRQKLAAAGLKAFLLYLWWNDFGRDTTRGDVEMQRRLEEEKEKEVMGEEYCSEKWGKELHRKAYPHEQIWPMV